MRAVLTLIAVLALVPAFVPAADAQVPTTLPTALEATVAALAAPVDGSATATGEVRYTVTGGAPGSATTRIAIAVADAPAWANVTVDPAETEVTVPPDPLAAGGSRTFTVPFSVTVSVVDAPARRPAEIRLAASAGENNPYGGSEAETTMVVEAAYVPGFTVAAVNETVSLAGDAPVTAAIRVTNRANGLTRVTFEVAEGAVGLRIVPPLPVTVESEATGATATTAEVPIQFLGDPGIDAPVDVEIRATGASPESPGVPATTTIVRFRVVPAETPEEDERALPLGGLAPLAALALAAAGRRRISSED